MCSCLIRETSITEGGGGGGERWTLKRYQNLVVCAGLPLFHCIFSLLSQRCHFTLFPKGRTEKDPRNKVEFLPLIHDVTDYNVHFQKVSILTPWKVAGNIYWKGDGGLKAKMKAKLKIPVGLGAWVQTKICPCLSPPHPPPDRLLIFGIRVTPCRFQIMQCYST